MASSPPILTTNVTTTNINSNNNNTVIGNGTVYCEPSDRVISKGLFLGENPIHFSFPLLMLQLGLVIFCSGTIHFLLKPFGQPKYVADLLGGILLGPSFLGQSETFYNTFFPLRSQVVLDVNEMLAVIFFAFLIGLRTDVSVVREAGRLALVIGLTAFLVPLILTNLAGRVLAANIEMEQSFQNTLPLIGLLQSVISYQAISSILKDMKLLNSELGRLALASSMISSLCSWILLIVGSILTDIKDGIPIQTLAAHMSTMFMIPVIIFAFRPIMFWMIRQTPEGKMLKESYMCAIILMILVTALNDIVNGRYPIYTVLLMGVIVPSGPPLGSGLEDKLECFVSAVLLPSFVLNAGRKVNLYLVRLKTFGIVELFIMLGFLGKVIGSVVPSLFSNTPLTDAVMLGLLLSCQGFLDVQFFGGALHFKLVSEESYSIMVIMAILQSAILTPCVKYLYDPSRRLAAYKRRTIQHSRRNGEFRILACIHEEDNVPTIINILEASNPTRESPIGVYVLDLVELVGRALPLLIAHPVNKDHHKSTRISRIMRAFRQYEVTNQGLVTVQCFTSIAPYATIHEDICTLALDKSISLVIVPFNRSDSSSVRTANKNVIDRAPCSVAILVDRGMAQKSRVIVDEWFTFHVCAIFIGGEDDSEALAYGSRMADHPHIRLTVIRIFDIEHATFNLIEQKLDLNAINDFKIMTMNNNRVAYKEEGVTEGSGTARVLHSLTESAFDLIIVGRRHNEESPVIRGLGEWSEIKELGVIGDILGSSDFKSKASVLVVQQQVSAVEDMIQCHLHLSTNPNVQSPSLNIPSHRDLEKCNSKNQLISFAI